MRKVLLASPAILAFAMPGIAFAQIPVTDGASLAQRAAQQLQTMGEWASQARSMAAQISELQSQLAQAQMAYRAVTGVRDLGSAMYAMNVAGIQNPLPISPLAVQSLVSGVGGVSGISSGLSGLQMVAATANRIYVPTSDAFRAREMVANADGLAGVQALAQRSYQASAERLNLLSAMRARLDIASDPKEVADLTAGIGIVQADIASHQQQLQAVGVMASAQQQVRVQRDDEQERRCLDRLIAFYSQAAVRGDCPAPSAQPPASATAMAVAYNNGGAAGAYAGGVPMETMLAQSWGQQAADNATRLGVNPTALAATCLIESGCQNVRGTGTVSGAFQMTDGTYTAAMRQAGGTAGLDGKMDPAVQSIAASQELKSAATILQNRGVANPTILDTRAIYNFGAGAGPELALADPSTSMIAALPTYSAETLARNGVTPGMTVGQWRASVAAKLGGTASQPVLLNTRSI